LEFFKYFIKSNLLYWSCRYKKIVLILWAELQIEVPNTFLLENGWGYASNCWNY